MNAPASILRLSLLPIAAAFAASTCFAADTVLHRVPSDTPQTNGSATLGYVSLTTAEPRALYVSSGTDLKLANNIADSRQATSFTFAANDAEPTAVIDLGQSKVVSRVTAAYAARKGTMTVYVAESLPGTAGNEMAADLPATLRIDAAGWSTMRKVAAVTNDGTQPGAAADFAPTTGRYVLLRWHAANERDGSFTLAEVAAFGGDDQNRTATRHTRRRYSDVSDSKDVADNKDVADTKDIPEEGPQAPPPGEGPPPGLPQPPPFTFIPQVVPVSP